MDIRERFNRNPAVTGGAALALIILAGLVIIWQIRSTAPRNEDQAYFTLDDGKTWFIDDITKVPPFEKNGKMAVKAYLYKCKGVDQPFVGYVERFADPVMKQLQELQERTRNAPDQAEKIKQFLRGASINGLEYKKPGDQTWTRGPIQVLCPNGRSDDLERVIAVR